MKDNKNSKTWVFETAGVEGDCQPFGVDIFAFAWKDTGAIAHVLDPLYRQSHKFTVYTVTIHDKEYEFAAGEFSNLVWGFYVAKE